jgi:phage virion morphogenesis protein
MSRKIVVDNSDLKKWTGKVTSRLRDLHAPLQASANHMEKKIQQQFATETDPDGDPWEPLKPETLAKKQGSGSILVHSGKLRDSFRYDLTEKTLTISSDSPVFTAHDQGVLPQPERKILGINAEDKNRIAGLVKGYVRGSR